MRHTNRSRSKSKKSIKRTFILNNIFTTSVKFIISIILGTTLFFISRPFMVKALETNEQDNEINYSAVIADTFIDEDNYRQIIIRDIYGKTIFKTSEPYTHANPLHDGKLVVWMSQIDANWQISVYNIELNKTTQLTYMGNNVNPKVSGDFIAWEGLIKGIWEVFLFDGIRTTKITQSGKTAQNVQLDDNFLAFNQLIDGKWYVFLKNLQTGELISMEDEGKNPKFSGDSLVWYLPNGKVHTKKLFSETEPNITESVDTKDNTAQDTFNEFSDALNKEQEDAIDILINEETKESTESSSSTSTQDVDKGNDVSIDDIKDEINNLNQSSENTTEEDIDISKETNTIKSTDEKVSAIDSVINLED